MPSHRAHGGFFLFKLFALIISLACLIIQLYLYLWKLKSNGGFS